MINAIRNLFKGKQEQRSLSQFSPLSGYGLFDGAYTGNPLQVPVVNQAVRKIGGSIAMMPIKCKKHQRVFDRPHKDQSTSKMLTLAVESLLIDGNAYIEAEYSDSGKLKSLYCHYFKFVSVEVVGNEIRYRVRDNFGRQRVVLSEYMIHIKANDHGDLIGKSPVHQCKTYIDIVVEQAEYLSEYFKNSNVPNGFLVIDEPLSAEAQTRLKQTFSASHGKGKRHKLAVLEDGLKYQGIQSHTMVESDYTRIYTLMVDEICRIFNISPLQVGDISKATYNNTTEANKSFLYQTLQPWIFLIQAELTHYLNLKQKDLEFDLSPIKAGEIGERMDMWATAINAGIVSPEYVAEREGFPKPEQQEQKPSSEGMTDA